jgi:hypothetical protein
MATHPHGKAKPRLRALMPPVPAHRPTLYRREFCGFVNVCLARSSSARHNGSISRMDLSLRAE